MLENFDNVSEKLPMHHPLTGYFFSFWFSVVMFWSMTASTVSPFVAGAVIEDPKEGSGGKKNKIDTQNIVYYRFQLSKHLPNRGGLLPIVLLHFRWVSCPHLPGRLEDGRDVGAKQRQGDPQNVVIIQCFDELRKYD